MALKPVYVIDGQRWLPIGRAAALLATDARRIKRLMGDGTLDWRQLRPNSTVLLVAEDAVLQLRASERSVVKEVRRRAEASTRPADSRAASMAKTAPVFRSAGRGPGVFEPTWDPRAVEGPIDGREPDRS